LTLPVKYHYNNIMKKILIMLILSTSVFAEDSIKSTPTPTPRPTPVTKQTLPNAKPIKPIASTPTPTPRPAITPIPKPKKSPYPTPPPVRGTAYSII